MLVLQACCLCYLFFSVVLSVVVCVGFKIFATGCSFHTVGPQDLVVVFSFDAS